MPPTGTVQNDVKNDVQEIQHTPSESQNFLHRIHRSITAILEGNKPKSNIAVLDSVRAIAILIVVFYHLDFHLHVNGLPWVGPYLDAAISTGSSGVTLFLVLSGFLLFLPYIRSLLFDNAWPSVKQFYLRRALRIMPAYYISLFLLIILTNQKYLRPDHFKDLVLFLTFLMDSATSTYQRINTPFWTLAVEWQFYMILPWLALAMRPLVQRGSLKRRVWMLISCVGGVIIWGIASRFGGYFVTTINTGITLGLPPTIFKAIVALLYGIGGRGPHGKFLEDFGAGMVVAVCYIMAHYSVVQGKWNTVLRRISPWLLVGSILWLYIIALWSTQTSMPASSNPIIAFIYNDTVIWTFSEFGFALGYGSLMLAVLFSGSFVKRIFEWSPFRWIGLISFSMYIWHRPLLYPFLDAETSALSGWGILKLFCLGVAWIVIAIIPFSFGNFALIERPFMKFSDSLRQKKAQPAKHSPA
ncbi:MAG TPA: acyltransferase [Ktedonobacteraceae bacterium]